MIESVKPTAFNREGLNNAFIIQRNWPVQLHIHTHTHTCLHILYIRINIYKYTHALTHIYSIYFGTQTLKQKKKHLTAYLSRLTVELMCLLTFDTSLFPVSAESPLLITFLQSLAVLRLYYQCSHFLCPGAAASNAARSNCCCRLHR